MFTLYFMLAKYAFDTQLLSTWLQSVALTFVMGWLLIEPLFILLIWRREGLLVNCNL